MQATLAPVEDSQRLPALDVARGFALLGILMVNVQSFGEPFADFLRPAPEAEEGWPAWGAFYFVKTFCESKFFTLFSTLFGMGLALQMGRAQARGQSFLGMGSRRLLFLGVIGFLHATLLWYGDILFTYFLCAIPFVFMVRWKVRSLLILASVLLSLTTFMSSCFMGVNSFQRAVAESNATQSNAVAHVETATGLTEPNAATDEQKSAPADTVDAASAPDSSPFGRFWTSIRETQGASMDPEKSPIWRETEREVNVNGPWLDAMGMRVFTWLLLLVVSTFMGWYFWIVAMFAIGAVLLKAGTLAPEKRPWLRRIAVVGWGVGVPLSLLNSFVLFGSSSFLVSAAGGGLSVIGSSAFALGTFAVIALLATDARTSGFMKVFANVGRLGLSNYLLQTAICTTIFYYWGFGLFDDLTRVQRMGIVFGVYAFQLIVSALWLRVFRIGPMEWLWRTFTYLKVQPILRAK